MIGSDTSEQHKPKGKTVDITGVSYDQVRQAVEKVSSEKYGGNLTLHSDSKSVGKGFRGRITGIVTGGPGTRCSASGRRGKYACWHAYRDVLLAVFDMNPNARVRTAMATYKGLQGFEAAYPETGRRNIGSMMCPVTMPELCDC